MNLASFRIKLALALGLPALAACGGASSPPPKQPPLAPRVQGTDNGQAVAYRVGSAVGEGGKCAVDQVHEHVCGLTDPASTNPKANAAAPHEACTVDPRALQQFDDHLFIEASRWGTGDPALATFAFDAARTKDYRYGGTVNPGDTWCCYQRCAPLPVTTPRTAVPPGLTEHERCVPPPEAGTSFPAKGAPQCPAGLAIAVLDDEPLDAAPFQRFDAGENQCCYAVASKRKCPGSMHETESGGCEFPSRGRPLREDGTLVLAKPARSSEWRDAIAVTAMLDASARAYAAAAWTREGAAEHASVAAFARLSIELMNAGAPAALVDDAHAAARDEIRHATAAYGLASAFAGEDIGPGRLELASASRALSLVELASECFRDGCVEETVAAMAAAEARDRALPGAVRDTLVTIAGDEARHAELAFQIVAWALRTGGDEVRARIAADLAELRAATGPAIAGDPPGFDERLGVLAAATSRAVRARTLATIVVPCTEALLAQA